MKKIILSILIVTFWFSVFAQNHRDSIDVLNYKISIDELNFAKKTISANTVVTLKPVFDNTQSIKLDLLGLQVDKIIIDGKKSKNWLQNDSLIIINLRKSANADKTLAIQVFYEGKPQKDATWGGFYFTKKNVFNVGIGMSSLPHSFGRIWFPCNDIFTDKATFEYVIRTDKKFTASAGGLQADTKHDKSKNIFHWVQKNPIPPYLAAFAVADYELIEDVYDGIERKIPINIFTFSGKRKKTEKSVTNLKKVMALYENRFGAYRWDKVGYSETSFTSGAMEHSENITMSSGAFDGTLNSETLIYHELAHSWFGNLVTCQSAEHIWLNESWASYCEAIVLEELYGDLAFRNYNRDRHLSVLYFAHLADEGYRSVADMDLSQTYGMTIYKKGASVVHTLRNYMTDSLFFPAVRQYLQKYSFANANTQNLKENLEKSGIDLDNFFDFWIYGKGFPHFQISDCVVTEKNGKFLVTVTVEQRLVAAEKFANGNRLEVNFMDKNFDVTSKIFEFSGQTGQNTFELPFRPALVMLDMNEKTADATIDNYVFIDTADVYLFSECLFKAEVKSLGDKAFLRVIHNVIEPTKTEKQDYLFNKKHYWTVQGIWNYDFDAVGCFYLTKLADKDFVKANSKNIFLMFRENPNSEWQKVETEHSKNCLKTKLKNGEYVMAMRE